MVDVVAVEEVRLSRFYCREHGPTTCRPLTGRCVKCDKNALFEFTVEMEAERLSTGGVPLAGVALLSLQRQAIEQMECAVALARVVALQIEAARPPA